jgi:hypothetical protein
MPIRYTSKIVSGPPSSRSKTELNQLNSKCDRACDKLPVFSTIFIRLKYAGRWTEKLFRELKGLEDKTVPETGVKRELDFRHLQELIVQQANLVFGDPGIAARWLQEPNLATDGRPPAALLESEQGYGRVRTLLDRIDYGDLA